MNKQEIQKRVLQNAKTLDLDKFDWDEEKNLFSSTENNLILDFQDLNNISFKFGNNCFVRTGGR